MSHNKQFYLLLIFIFLVGCGKSPTAPGGSTPRSSLEVTSYMPRVNSVMNPGSEYRVYFSYDLGTYSGMIIGLVFTRSDGATLIAKCFSTTQSGSAGMLGIMGPRELVYSFGKGYGITTVSVVGALFPSISEEFNRPGCIFSNSPDFSILVNPHEINWSRVDIRTDIVLNWIVD